MPLASNQVAVINDCCNSLIANVINNLTSSDALEFFEFLIEFDSENPNDAEFRQLLAELDRMPSIPRAQKARARDALIGLRSIQTEAAVAFQGNYGNGEEHLAYDVHLGQEVPLNLHRIGPRPRPGEINAVFVTAINSAATALTAQINRERARNQQILILRCRLSSVLHANSSEQDRLLQQHINEFNRFFYFINISVANNDPNLSEFLLATENSLLELINLASSDDASIHQKRWLFANRREIQEVTDFLDRKRVRLHLEREQAEDRAASDALNRLKRLFGRVEDILTNDESALLLDVKRIYTQRNIARGSAAGTSATGSSAFSFFAGPLVGIPVTAGTAAASALGTAGYGLYGWFSQYKEGIEHIEAAIREAFHGPQI